MDLIVRNPQQFGAAIRRNRKKLNLTQGALAARMHSRQATISTMESGEPGTQLGTLMDALAALDLEIVIRPRTTKALEELLQESF